jgi:hypothetical protein
MGWIILTLLCKEVKAVINTRKQMAYLLHTNRFDDTVNILCFNISQQKIVFQEINSRAA